MTSSSNIRAGAAYIELYVKDSRLVKGLSDAARRLSAFGAGITAIGTKLTALGAGLVVPLAGAAKVFADMGSDLVDMSQRTGVSVEALSELGFAAEQSGSDLATLEGSLRKMQKFLVSAAHGSKSAQNALGGLGLTVGELNHLSPEDQFTHIADRLQRIEDPAVRTALAMQLFGKSGTKLLPLMQNGARGMEELRQRARDLGLTMSTEDAQAAEAFGDRLDTLWKVLRRATFAVGSALEPTLSALADSILRSSKLTIDWITRNKQLVTTVFNVGAAVLASGAAVLALGLAFSAVGAILGGVATVITATRAAIGTLGTLLASLLSPIGLVVAAVGGLTAYVLLATSAGAEALAWLGEQFSALKDTAMAAWKGIGDALAAGDLALAAKVLWLSLKMEWQRGIGFLEARWLQFKGFFVGVWQSAVFGIARAMTDAWAGIQTGWIESIGVLSDTWTNFIGFLQRGWNRFAGFFATVWARIKGLFGDTNADEEIARINQEVAQQNEDLQTEQGSTLAGRQQQRQQQLDQIERDRVGAQSALKDTQSREQADRDARQNADLKASEAELARARRQWQDALKQAANVRVVADSKSPARFSKPDMQLPTAEGLDALIQDTRRKIDVVGSFNPLAARGLGADTLSERTAKASEQIAANTKRLVQEAQHGGLVFG